MLLTPNLSSMVAMTLGRDEPNLAAPIFTKFGWYDVGPILRPYLEGGHYWSMWAWLSTTNLNRHTFSLLQFQCTSYYSVYHGSHVGLCPHFCPEPIIL